MNKASKSLLLVAAWLALCGFRIVTVAVSGGGGSSSGAYDLAGEALTCSDTGNVTMTCGDDTTLTVDVNTGGALAITDGTNTTNLSPSAAGLTIDDALVFGGGADLNGTTLTCSGTGNVSIACGDDTTATLDVNSSGCFVLTDGTNATHLCPISGAVEIEGPAAAEAEIRVDNIRSNVDASGLVVQGNTQFNSSSGQITHKSGATTKLVLTNAPASYGGSLLFPSDGGPSWSNTTTAGDVSGIRMKQNSSANGLYLTTGASGAANLRLTPIEATVPAEPLACDGTSRGTIAVVDDTDDAGASVVCVCLATGDDGAGAPDAWDWRRLDDNATACPFF